MEVSPFPGHDNDPSTTIMCCRIEFQDHFVKYGKIIGFGVIVLLKFCMLL